MGLTKRKDSYYVQFRVLDNGKTLSLAKGVPGVRMKRWKMGCLNKDVARQLEAKRDLMLGLVKSEREKPVLFGEWAKAYLGLEEVQGIASYAAGVLHQRTACTLLRVEGEITPAAVEAFRAHRKATVSTKTGKPESVQTVNHDHVALKHCLPHLGSSRPQAGLHHPAGV